jgi:WD40 repeat protein
MATYRNCLLPALLATGFALVPLPDCRIAASDQQEGASQPAKVDLYGDPLPPGATSRIGTVRLCHPGQVDYLQFAPDGKKVITGGGPAVCLWDASTGALVKKLNRPEGSIYCWALSRNGKVLATASGHGERAHIWNIETGKLTQRPDLRGQIVSLALSPDGKRLVVGCSGGDVYVWNVTEEKTVGYLSRHRGSVAFAQYSKDGNTLITRDDYYVRTWDVASLGARRVIDGFDKRLVSVACSADGARLVSVTESGSIKLWDGKTGNDLTEVGQQEVLGTSVAISDDGTHTATSSGSCIWVWRNGCLKDRIEIVGNNRQICSLALSPDGKTLAAASTAGVVRLWEVSSGREKKVCDSLEGLLFKPCLLTGTKMVAVRTAAGIGFHDLDTGKQLYNVPARWARLAPFPDGKTIAIADSDRRVIFCWDALGRKEVSVLRDDASCVFLEVARSGDYVVSTYLASDRTFVRSMKTGALVCTIPVGWMGPGRVPIPHALSPDGRILAASKTTRTGCEISLWDVATGKLAGTLTYGGRFESHLREGSVAFSPDGTLLAAANETGVRIWELSGKRITRAIPTPARVVAFSPDGQVLAIAEFEHAVHLLETATWETVGIYQGHARAVHALAFSQDGRTLVSASDDNTVLAWSPYNPPNLDLAFPTGSASPAQLENLWDDLGKQEADSGYRALCILASRKDDAVRLLSRKLAPTPHLDRRKVLKLVEELGHDDFGVREAATKALLKIGPSVEPVLRSSMTGKLDLEVRKRVGFILASLVSGPALSLRLRQSRSLRVLEQVGSAEARQILQALSLGDETSFLTRESKNALQRLHQQ